MNTWKSEVQIQSEIYGKFQDSLGHMAVSVVSFCFKFQM